MVRGRWDLSFNQLRDESHDEESEDSDDGAARRNLSPVQPGWATVEEEEGSGDGQLLEENGRDEQQQAPSHDQEKKDERTGPAPDTNDPDGDQ